MHAHQKAPSARDIFTGRLGESVVEGRDPSLQRVIVGPARNASTATKTARSLASPIGPLKAALTSAIALVDEQAGQQSKTDQQISFRNR
jgi:hypothetical protein